MYKDSYNASAQRLLCSLNILFGDVPDTVIVLILSGYAEPGNFTFLFYRGRQRNVRSGCCRRSVGCLSPLIFPATRLYQTACDCGC